jgi:hypothetical protein
VRFNLRASVYSGALTLVLTQQERNLMAGVLDLLTSAFGGSVVGAIGAAFNKWQDAKIKVKLTELQIERDKVLNAHELEINKIQAVTRTKELEFQGLTESIGADKATYSVGSTSKLLIFVDGVRGLIRPILTGTLTGYCMITLFYLTSHYNVVLSDEQVYKLVFLLVDNLVVCTGIALTWWFGSRPSNEKIVR